MTATTGPATGGVFTAALIQTRTKLSPQDNLKDTSALIREAKSRGADYVQTPEMSNILAADRTQMFNIVR